MYLPVLQEDIHMCFTSRISFIRLYKIVKISILMIVSPIKTIIAE